MNRRRVKITGIGPVTPAGIGREAFWNGILEPVSRIRAYSKLAEEDGPLVAASVANFDAKKLLRGFDYPKGTARHSLFALAATFLALEDAGIALDELQRMHPAVVTGSSLLDFGGIGAAIDTVQKKGVRFAQARVVYTTTLTAIPNLISNACGIVSRTMGLQTSCCAGMDAIGHAAELVATGEADIALCGGTECPLHRFPILELRAAGLTPMTAELPERISRPFDRWRTTGVVSEGACMLVLEPESSPRPGYSFISGYAYANDQPGDLCGGMATAAKWALAAAHLRPSEIEAINAWGPGHKQIDAAEANILERVFGPALRDIPVVSIKGAIGAPLGAAGAIQVGTAALGQKFGIVPPTVNWEYADPACPLNLSAAARHIDHASTLINAHGVGDVNSCIVLERC